MGGFGGFFSHPLKTVSNAVGNSLQTVASLPINILHGANIISDKNAAAAKALAKGIPQTAIRTFGAPVYALKNPKGFIHNPSTSLVDPSFRNTSAYRNIYRPAVKTGSAAVAGYATGGPIGAIIGAGAGIAGGSLNNKGYQPLQDAVAPAIAGYAAGSSDAGSAFNGTFNSAMNQGMGVGTALKQGGLAAVDSFTAPSFGQIAASNGFGWADGLQAAGLGMQFFGNRAGAGGGQQPSAGGTFTGGGVAPAALIAPAQPTGGGMNQAANQQQAADAAGLFKSLQQGVKPLNA